MTFRKAGRRGHYEHRAMLSELLRRMCVCRETPPLTAAAAPASEPRGGEGAGTGESKAGSGEGVVLAERGGDSLGVTRGIRLPLSATAVVVASLDCGDAVAAGEGIPRRRLQAAQQMDANVLAEAALEAEKAAKEEMQEQVAAMEQQLAAERGERAAMETQMAELQQQLALLRNQPRD